MKKSFILFLTSLFFITSCYQNVSFGNDSTLELSYFQYQSEDQDLLLELPELNDQLIFKNQGNDELLKFNVIKSINDKHLHQRPTMPVGVKKYFYFDGQQLFLQSTLFHPNDFTSYLEFHVRKWPKVFNQTTGEVSEESYLRTTIEYSSFNNLGQLIDIDYSEQITLSFNNQVFDRVIKVDLTDKDSISPNWQTPSLDYMYFDINKGLIGFDDKEGNEWRILSN
ncbi:conserved protein of unknown function [Tenacibaculum sp. 190524A05c]